METNENDEVIVDNEEETNEEVTETTEETTKVGKPKRTPQEEYDYHKGRTDRLAKKLGIKDEKVDSVKNTPNERSSDLEYGQIALLRQEGIKGAGEMALFKEIMSETGKGVLDVLDSNYFKSRLADFRENQASTDAIPKGKNRSAQVASTNIDLAYAKFKETGEWPSDFDTAKKLKDKIVEAEQGQASIYSRK